MGADLKKVIRLHNWALKHLLGVRKSTPNNVCYVEVGYPSLPELLNLKQYMFFSKMELERPEMTDDPLIFSMEIATIRNTPISRAIRRFIDTNKPDMKNLMQNVYERITASTGSRSEVYRNLNPNYTPHGMYKERHAVNNRYRMAFTLFRVSNHSLCIETERWNRRGWGRLPKEERLCVCGEVQTDGRKLNKNIGPIL